MLRPLVVSALAAVASWGHIGYPVWLAWRTCRLPDPSPPTVDDWPGVTVVVPAYQERTVIAAKVKGLRADGYPGELDVIVVAEDVETADAARSAGAEVIGPSHRLGKAEALNQGIAAARQPVVVITDANTATEPGSIAALVEWLGDPEVAAVAGEKRVAGARSGEGWFWRFESWLKRREARTGTTIGLVGELAAVRRERWRPLPALAVDDLWLAVDLIESGGRIAYEPRAVASEPADSLAADWQRRTRIVSGTIDVLVRRPQLLRPGSGVADQLWGHRLVRSSIGPAAHALLLATAVLTWRRSRVAKLFAAGHVLAAAALARTYGGARVTAPERLLAQVLFLQAVGLGGTARYLRGDRPARWPKRAR